MKSRSSSWASGGLPEECASVSRALRPEENTHAVCVRRGRPGLSPRATGSIFWTRGPCSPSGCPPLLSEGLHGHRRAQTRLQTCLRARPGQLGPGHCLCPPPCGRVLPSSHGLAAAHLLGSGATGAGPRGLSCRSGSNLRYKDCFLRADSLNCREGSRVTGAPDMTASTPRPTSRPGAALTRVACGAERRKQPGRPPRPVRRGHVLAVEESRPGAVLERAPFETGT